MVPGSNGEGLKLRSESPGGPTLSIMAEKRYHLIISGRVQGVLFRYNSKLKADRLGIYGWVQNMKDGSVEIVCQGEAGKLREFIDWCGKGPFLAKVRGIKITEERVKKEFQSFSIRYAIVV